MGRINGLEILARYQHERYCSKKTICLQEMSIDEQLLKIGLLIVLLAIGVPLANSVLSIGNAFVTLLVTLAFLDYLFTVAFPALQSSGCMESEHPRGSPLQQEEELLTSFIE